MGYLASRAPRILAPTMPSCMSLRTCLISVGDGSCSRILVQKVHVLVFVHMCGPGRAGGQGEAGGRVGGQGGRVPRCAERGIMANRVVNISIRYMLHKA